MMNHKLKRLAAVVLLVVVSSCTQETKSEADSKPRAPYDFTMKVTLNRSLKPASRQNLFESELLRRGLEAWLVIRTGQVMELEEIAFSSGSQVFGGYLHGLVKEDLPSGPLPTATMHRAVHPSEADGPLVAFQQADIGNDSETPLTPILRAVPIWPHYPSNPSLADLLQEQKVLLEWFETEFDPNPESVRMNKVVIIDMARNGSPFSFRDLSKDKDVSGRSDFTCSVDGENLFVDFGKEWCRRFRIWEKTELHKTWALLVDGWSLGQSSIQEGMKPKMPSLGLGREKYQFGFAILGILNSKGLVSLSVKFTPDH